MSPEAELFDAALLELIELTELAGIELTELDELLTELLVPHTTPPALLGWLLHVLLLMQL